MKINYNPIISLFLFLVFLASYFLPFYSYNQDSLLGFQLYFFQLAEYAFIENIIDYFYFLLKALIIVWIILMFIWSFKNSAVKFYKVILLSALAILSSGIWYLQLEDRSGVTFGYWVWVLSIIGISSFLIYSTYKKGIIIKENTATK